MKPAIALVVACAVAAVAALVVAVHDTRDPVPGKLRSCIRDGGGSVVHSADSLARLRSDLGAKAVRVVDRSGVGSDTAALLDAPGYRVLAVRGRSGPSLDSGDVPLAVYEHTDGLAVVALETDPVRGVLAGCLGRVRNAA